MPIEPKLELKGLRELNEKLKALGPAMERKALRKAVRAGAQVIHRQVKANAAAKFTTRSGNLVRGIRLRVVKRRDGRITGRVSASAPHSHLLERGWKHTGRRKGGPGKPVAGRPFMEPAFDAQAAAALAAVEAEVLKFIEGL